MSSAENTRKEEAEVPGTANSAPGIELGGRSTGIVTADEFKAVFRHHPSGVAVITADDGTGPVAMTVSSVSSVSAEPPLLVFSASSTSSAAPTIRNAEAVVVHLISADQIELARLASTSHVDRFGPGVRWDRLATGEPYYPDARCWIRGRAVNRLPAGTAMIHVVEALQAKVPEEGMSDVRPVIYHDQTWHVLGDK